MIMPKKGKNLLIWTSHVTMTKRNEFISNELQPKIIPYFSVTKQTTSSATTILSCSPVAHNTTASLDKLTCTNYVDFGKCQDRFGRFSWSKNDSNYLGVKLKVFKKDDKKEFRLAQNVTMGETDFKQYIRLRNQLVKAAEYF